MNTVLDILKAKREKIGLYKERNPLRLLENVENKVLKIDETSKRLEDKLGDFKEQVITTLEDIREIVTPKPKVFHRHRPLRDAMDGTIYQHPMDKPRRPKERIDAYYTFRIAITVLKHTGLRFSEIRTLTKKDIDTLIVEQRLQVYQVKQNRHREVTVSPHAAKQLTCLEKEIKYLFLKTSNLSNDATPTAWQFFMNNRLKPVASLFKLNLKSHSFRVNMVTLLLNLAPAHKVMKTMGHKDIRSTMAYSRYSLDKL